MTRNDSIATQCLRMGDHDAVNTMRAVHRSESCIRKRNYPHIQNWPIGSELQTLVWRWAIKDLPCGRFQKAFGLVIQTNRFMRFVAISAGWRRIGSYFGDIVAYIWPRLVTPDQRTQFFPKFGP